MPETEDQKTFSIIVATYNCGRKVEKTLESIISQEKELFELIVVDGASTDETLDYIKKYESYLTLISGKDVGVYDAFNKGIRLTTGKYLYFIGAGDCLKAGILKKVKQSLPEKVPAFVYGKCYFVKHKTINGGKFNAETFIRDNLCQQGIFYHRNIFDIIGNFDLQYKIFADWFFNLRCFLENRVNKHFIDLVIADYEEDGISSEIGNDPVFMKNFPVFVNEKFGVKSYISCKLFLRFPYVFNYIYYSHYKSLLIHLSYKYLPESVILWLKPYVKGFRKLKRTTKNRI